MENKNLDLLDGLIASVEQLKFKDENELDKIKKRADMILKNILPQKDYSKKLDINFWVMFSPCTNDQEKEAWEEGRGELFNLLSTVKEEIELFGDDYKNHKEKITGKKIFIVHGHDEEMKQSVARFIENLELEAIIFHERPDKGRNILDKLIQESKDAIFAVVLLSPDDIGYDVDKKEQRYRARQNVVMELGFFIGLLEKDRVCALYKKDKDIELPSDFAGNLYKEYDSSGSWKMELAKEIKASGIKIDMNKVI